MAVIPTKRLEGTLPGWGRVAAALVLILAALDWVGWATGIQALTRIHPSWTPMTPWTAVWSAALAVAVLVLSGSPSPARTWVGRGLAVAVGVVAVVVLAEYATGRTFGLDQVWFGDAMRRARPTVPGRPGPQTALTALLLSITVALSQVNRPWARRVRVVSMVAAMVVLFVTVLAYVFGAIAGLQIELSTGVAALTLVALLLLGAAIVTVQPEWWLIARSDRSTLTRLGMILAGFPLLVGLSRRAFLALGLGQNLALTFATATTTILLGTAAYRLSRRELAAQTLLHASVDSMLNPQMLLEAVRDRTGQVVDFVYRSANLAFCSYRGWEERDIIGQSLLEAQPNLRSLGLFERYINCVDTGESLFLEDFEMFNSMIGETRCYDIRVVRAGVDLISLTFSDVTERYQAAQRISASERSYRLLAENSSDMVTHVRDGRFAWVSPSVAAVVGGSPEYWIGRQVREIIPPEDAADFAARLATLSAGGTVQERIRVVATDGVTHWADLHARPLYDDDGHQDGFTGALRVVDDEVAARLAAREARQLQGRADALYRRSVDSAAVGMCLINPEGGFVDVNEAVCEFFGYDAETLKRKSWQELTAEKYLQADLDYVADVLEGRIESYRMTKEYRHADGHPIWGDLSVGCVRDADGRVEVFVSQINDITAQVQAREQLEEARRQQQRDDARYRNSIDNAAVGMCMVTPEGVLQDVNQAMCQLFGYEAEAMNGTHWQDFTAAEFLDAEVKSMNGILEGRIDSYRMVKHYQHADGYVVWGDLSVSGVRDDDGNLEHMVALITDVTAEVQARERLVTSEEHNRELAQGLQSELNSAAKYLQSVLPADMTGQVSVSTRYLPSNTLGGDSFDFRWIDDDHMVVYLLDVSGHGVESALIAVSVHNMLRSASFTTETMLEPDRVLAALNHQFGMNQHDDNYFTIFYGVYQRSSATMRYANAGHPPALLLTGGQVTELSSQSLPVGMFDESSFITATVPVPPGSQMLLYSDGAYELPLDGGGLWPLGDFVGLCTLLCASPDWTLDDVIDNVLRHSATGSFDDDCCLVQLTFD